MAKSRKSNYHQESSGAWGKVFKVLGVIFLASLILGGAYSLTLLQPRKLKWDDPGLAPVGDISPEVSALLDKSIALEKKFREEEKQRPITKDDLPDLREAIQLQQEYLDKSLHDVTTGNQRIEEMTVSLQSYESQPLHEQSLALEDHATDLENKQDYDGARAALKQATDLEDQILHNYSKGNLYDTANAHSVALHHHLRYLEALPISQESQADEVTADAAYDKQDWRRALDYYQKAYDLQLKINREYEDQAFVNNVRLANIEQQLTALRSLPAHEKIDKLQADAHQADDAANYSRAAQLYQEAQSQQRDLIAQFPKSRFADPTLIDSLDILRQTALSRTLATDIKTQATTLFDDLRHRRIEPAKAMITVLGIKARQFHQTFPRSTLLDDELQKRLDYLDYKHNDLAAIQDQTYGQLLALPGQQRFLLCKNEVPQSLYQLVVSGNPSHNIGPNLPVESVNWIEAQEFCHRLSWVLGRPVHLPTKEQFLAALGSTDTVDVSANSWNLDNSNGQTQAVASKTANANGFSDLLGNVAEWLERLPESDLDVAPVIGGNVQTPVDQIRATPNHPANIKIDERNPYTGFRFVVDSDDSAPLLPLPVATPTTTETLLPTPSVPIDSNEN